MTSIAEISLIKMRTKCNYYSNQSTFKNSFPSVMHKDTIRSVHTFLSQAVMSYSLRKKKKNRQNQAVS